MVPVIVVAVRGWARRIPPRRRKRAIINWLIEREAGMWEGIIREIEAEDAPKTDAMVPGAPGYGTCPIPAFGTAPSGLSLVAPAIGNPQEIGQTVTAGISAACTGQM